MRILRNYFLREFITPLFLSLGVLSFVMLLGSLIRLTDLVINKGVDIFSITKLFLFMMSSSLSYTLPLGTLTAVLFSLGRLSSDNEIMAIRASGVHLFSLISPLLTVGLILSLLLVVFNDRVIPYAHFAQRKTIIEVGMKNPTAALEPGIFINSFQKYILFIYQIDQKKNRMGNVRIYEPQEGRPTRTIVAKRGEFIAIPEQNMVKLKLMDGTSDEPDPKNPTSFYKLNFKTYFMSLNLGQMRDKDKIGKKPKDMTVAELHEEAKKLEREGIDPTPLLTEINEKISMAFSCFVFVLLGFPLAAITKRRGVFINFAMACLFFGLYYALLLGAEALCLQGFANPRFMIWLPNIILGSLGAYLTYRACAS
ncbi:MAG: LptF/LptG family permease [Candidatus Omnitrophica bacterium]|nr:LptF/LptG family permease [Candidatus Omnitrophota bacterium]MDD5653221.1 LptF/LptG family permease [Candidatus Omnitrophota bacterium]